MARNGYRIFDADTHVGPVMEALNPWLGEEVKSRLPAWDAKKKLNVHKGGYEGHTTYTIGERSYRRKLGNAEAYTDKTTLAGAPAIRSSPVDIRKPSAEVQTDPAVRIREMDIEGIDVNFILPSAWLGGFSSTDDPVLEMGMYQAYHRWMNDYCGAFPERLGGLICVSSRNIEASLAEMRKWKNARWPWGMLVYTAGGLPLDHPDLEPLWAEAQEHDLAVALHTFTAYPPYAPGGQDTWGNRMLQTSCAHPWCGQRNIAALIGGGVMERYPRLRVGTLEAGHGWLPNWLLRLDEMWRTMRPAMSDDAIRKPSEYALSGRYFQSIDIFEGEKMTQAVNDLIGDHVLMFGSDYPHGESYYPESANIVTKWNLPEASKQKLLWDNAAKFYARSGMK
jgi:predicted TIM-barrel fold metal-dependent hydrolase